MIEVSVVTEIDASAATVWRILTNLPDYHAWNPFIRYARGSLEVGGNVRLQVHTSWRVPLFFHASVIEREEARLLRWRGTVVGPWLASGDHSFTILPQGEHHVRFIQREQFGGLLPRAGAPLLLREAHRGFTAMNRALAARAERVDRAQPETAKVHHA